MKKEYIKITLLRTIVLFIILYLLKLTLYLFKAHEIVDIYFGVGIIIGIGMERWRTRKVFKALDELAESFEKDEDFRKKINNV